mmetsp:Transcript_12779/g.19787  ORF Transcript_12779/g.19787 Transcript_12779/m.19787 type:complete len:120 (-) Transcript_12779:663-1022(-)
MDIDAAANLVKFSITEYIYNDPPEFVVPLEPVAISASVGSDITNEDYTIELPDLTDPNGDEVATIEPLIPMQLSDVIKYDKQEGKFTISVAKLTPDILELYPSVSVPLTLKDEQGALSI